MRTSTTAATVEEWVHGWALSRRTPAPVREPDGYRIDVGKVVHRVRFVLPDTATVAHRARTLTAPGTWLKVCGERDAVIADLTPAWLVSSPEFLMTVDLRVEDVTVPSPYRVEVIADPGGAVCDAVVRAADGSTASSGRVAVWGAAAVVDQVSTDPAHRRRGLGRVVMRSLAAAAVERGASRAVLLATEEGARLYRSVGWSVASPVTAAHLPVDER
ncbi:GNAT superfamily N-acetyltransferase [Saccharothrix coeruleofusca]|uniref:GNAT family N-acetyltransferase n=1 Tax=Saccharothrix coeruleofusca TaxID=33919 RepID=UPI001AE3ECF0|nr:GNAT family N-acetyltransferase [Saccharothrix coeruleofusca]MBP2340175.1 GNAT superfamily N-acetyltransferase [Saccharothrix coeruleofusca]